MAEQKKLSLCIIAKDEEPLLLDCLEKVEGMADEIIVVDIGSCGHATELAKQFGAVVYHPGWEDDFSKIKNFCMDHASGEWILFLQADEMIPRDQIGELKLLMLNAAAEGYLVEVEGGQDKRVETCPAQYLRLLRNRKDYRFQYRSFEYIPDEELYSVLNGDVRIVRRGTTVSWQTEERVRLLQTDLKERPQDGYVQYLQGIELLNQERYKESAVSFELTRHTLCGGCLYAPHLYKCLAVCFLALSRLEAAEEVLGEGIWLFPYFTDLHVLRAELYRRQDKYAEALRNLEICLMLRNSPNVCVPKPTISIPAIVKMREKVRKEWEGSH